MQKLRSTLLFYGLTLLGMAAGSALSLLLVYLTSTINRIDQLPVLIKQLSNVAYGWYILISIQAISHICTYLLPALLYWKLVEHRRWYEFNTYSLRSVRTVWVGLASVFLFLPFNEFVIQLNKQLSLPDLLSGAEKWMMRKETENGAFTDQLVNFDSSHQLAIALFIIGFVAPLGEEVFFRGVVQRKLVNWLSNKHVAIWLSASLFSAIHFQFYGFFPRLLLGALFGYLYIWSGNLWIAILAHALNNSFTVLTLYNEQQTVGLAKNVRDFDLTSWSWISLSLISFFLSLYLFHRTNNKHINSNHSVLY